MESRKKRAMGKKSTVAAAVLFISSSPFAQGFCHLQIGRRERGGQEDLSSPRHTPCTQQIILSAHTPSIDDEV